MKIENIKKICVIGAGVMGLDVAQEFAKKGFQVVVRDLNDEILAASSARMNKSLDKLVGKGKMTAEAADAVKAAITFTTKLEDAADCDLVLEAIVENLEIKKSIFKQLDEICKPETILATNTSSVSITAMAYATNRPEKVVGMHFFNPPGVMKLVEVIDCAGTDSAVSDLIFDLCLFIGKDPIKVNESPGFVVNRLLVPMVNEAIMVLEEGIASAEDIDKAMKLGANHPMGPLALSDLIGNDVILNIMNTIYDETGDPKYRASKLLKNMVRAGKLGKKTGEGFFVY